MADVEKQQEEQKSLATIESNGRGLQLTNLDDMWRFARAVAASGLAPKGMEKPETLLIALEMGAEVGLPAMQALQNIAVVNGRAVIWGDAVPGLVKASGKQEWYKQKKIGQPGTDGYGYEVESKRRGDPESIVTTFTVADAKRAGLWGKTGPWTFYPDRMLLNRARAFNARDNFPDVLKGMYTAEEIQDVGFEVIDDKPLADGDKTKSLAEKLAAKNQAQATEPTETVDESTGEVLKDPDVADHICTGEPPNLDMPERQKTQTRRGRPKKDDEDAAGTFDPALANETIAELINGGKVTMAQYRKAIKDNLDYATDNVPPTTLHQDEAVTVLEALGYAVKNEE